MHTFTSRSSLTYREARDRLYSLEHWGIKLGLDNIREFCATLGNPQSRFLSVHVAGTNGKGSTSAYLDSILRAAEYRVGRYTSPHLKDFRERIHINGRPVPASWVTSFVEQHWDYIVAKRFSYFEVTTALAFDSFARAKTDLAIVEVGLGGRFDATNIIDPLACIITRIARDHEHVLGHTAGKIAFEKAGIVKTGVPVVVGPLIPAAETRIRTIANQRLAPLWTAHELLFDRGSPEFSFRTGRSLRTPLAGAHQLTNLAIALAATRLINAQGIPVLSQVLRRGVANTRWAARFQIVPGVPTIIYDAGHNPDGARAIVATWKQVFGNRRCVCVFNTRPEKNHVAMFAALSQIVSHWVFCPMPDSPHIGKHDLSGLASRQGQPWQWEESPRLALSAARKCAGSAGLVLVTGSHFLIGAVIPARLVNGDGSSIPVLYSITRSQLLAAAQDRGAAF